jgi:predicted transcriptional regulator
MFALPQEIEVWYIIPAIRREFARVFIKKGLTMEKAGNILGVTKAAISQYLSKKRAKAVKIPPTVSKEIEKSASILIKDNKKAVKEMLRILSLMKKHKCECAICKKFNPGISKQCNCDC